MKPMEKKVRQQAVEASPAHERRTGMDRRMLNYDYYIPERRVTADRRGVHPYAADRDRSHGEWRDRRRYA